MQLSKRLVSVVLFLFLIALTSTRQPPATAKIVIDEPSTPVGHVLYRHLGGTMYTVQAGDTLWDIAIRYAVDFNDLWDNNTESLRNPNLIRTGQVLWIPNRGRVGTRTANCPTQHNVVIGDTLFGIAYRYGADIEQIMLLNSIADADYIYFGTQLEIPC